MPRSSRFLPTQEQVPCFSPTKRPRSAMRNAASTNPRATVLYVIMVICYNISECVRIVNLAECSWCEKHKPVERPTLEVKYENGTFQNRSGGKVDVCEWCGCVHAFFCPRIKSV